MPDLYDTAERFREQLLARDRATAAALVDAYTKAWVEIRASIARLTMRIDERRQAGEEMPVSWLFDQDRLARLERQVAAEVDRIADRAGALIEVDQGEAVGLAQEHTAQVLDAGAVSSSETFAVLPTTAAESLVGFSGNGSPLRTLLDELGPSASKRIRAALITGVATGQSVADIARGTRAAFGGNMARALLTARTEMLRSYREAAHLTRLEHADVLDGWVRIAALQSNTCAACLALHGTVHKLSERLREHPGGRCVAIPLVKGERFDGERGPDWFARQGVATHEAVLGRGGAAAYESGAVALEDFVGTARSKEWGPHQYAKSLRTVLGTRQARMWITRGVTA